MTPIVNFKLTGQLPVDETKAKVIKRIAPKFCMIKHELFRKSYTGPILRCVGPGDAAYILKEIHEGICGHHIGGRTLSNKALRAGCYKPMALKDAHALVLK